MMLIKLAVVMIERERGVSTIPARISVNATAAAKQPLMFACRLGLCRPSIHHVRYETANDGSAKFPATLWRDAGH
jgi:hypothetical protein